MYLLILQIANIVLFSLSVVHIHMIHKNKRFLTDRMQKDVKEKKKLQRQEFNLFIYFFVATGVKIRAEQFNVKVFQTPGVMWIFELISSFLGDWSYGDSCFTRLAMDVPNLLAVSSLDPRLII